MQEIKQFLKSKGMTERTIKTYTSILNKIFNNIGEEFTEEQVELLLTRLNLKPRTYNLYRTIINFYTKKWLGYKIDFDKAKVPKHLPNYVTEEEFKLIQKFTPNIKHKLGLCLMYGSGLRSYELVRLKKHNLDFDNFIINIKNGKGQKDRATIINPKIVRILEIFAKSTKQDNPYLFQTYRGHISERSFQEVLKRAVNGAKIQKKISLHDLRHSFAINMVNKNIDIEEVRKMLGHSSLKTTQIYLQCKTSNLKEIALSLERNITQC